VNSFICIKCPSRDRDGPRVRSQTKVVETTVKVNSYAGTDRRRWSTVVTRTRECLVCGFVFTTKEMSATMKHPGRKKNVAI